MYIFHTAAKERGQIENLIKNMKNVSYACSQQKLSHSFQYVRLLASVIPHCNSAADKNIDKGLNEIFSRVGKLQEQPIPLLERRDMTGHERTRDTFVHSTWQEVTPETFIN